MAANIAEDINVLFIPDNKKKWGGTIKYSCVLRLFLIIMCLCLPHHHDPKVQQFLSDAHEN